MIEVCDHRVLREFDQEVRQVLGPGSLPEYTVEPKPLGIPVLLAYEKGSLSGAVTKGDPFGGEDVTPNVKTILTVPLNIESTIAGKAPPDHLEVWGIVYTEGSSEDQPEPISVSARQEVAASLIQADLKITARRPLNLFCFGAEREAELRKQIGVESHLELMLMLQDWGFRVNRPHIKRCAGISAVFEAIRLIEGQRERSLYEVDGAIVQLNPLEKRSAIEAALHHEAVIAYGFKTNPETDP